MHQKSRGSAVDYGSLALFGVVAIIILSYFGIYNSLVTKDLAVQGEWSEIQNQYQRRYDLIPRVVNSTKLYLNYEQGLLMAATEARSAWKNAVDTGTPEDQLAASEDFDQAMNRFMSIVVTVEAYPDLKGNPVVMSLIDELKGTENRIAVARGRYIDAAIEYNTAIRVWPNSIVANMNGCLPKPLFTAPGEAQNAPKVPV